APHLGGEPRAGYPLLPAHQTAWSSRASRATTRSPTHLLLPSLRQGFGVLFATTPRRCKEKAESVPRRDHRKRVRCATLGRKPPESMVPSHPAAPELTGVTRCALQRAGITLQPTFGKPHG